MHPIIKKLTGQIIVSTQAYPDTPLYGPQQMRAMAQSALLGGAAGIRACWTQDIKAIRELGDFPLIGIDKVETDQLSGVFITPDFLSAQALIEAGADIIGLDSRINNFRTVEDYFELLRLIKDFAPHILIMADCTSLADAKVAQLSGLVDIVATTLSPLVITGEPDLVLIKQMKETINLPINGEGGIWEVADLKAVLRAGADMVTIGSAISRPHLITERFVKFNHQYHYPDKQTD